MILLAAGGSRRLRRQLAAGYRLRLVRLVRGTLEWISRPLEKSVGHDIFLRSLSLERVGMGQNF
ncbi:MAG: hypothetical protein SH868_19645 [Bythopirellula sp.]|nr:hypothetical protein [Bythopirellula sp.]